MLAEERSKLSLFLICETVIMCLTLSLPLCVFLMSAERERTDQVSDLEENRGASGAAQVEEQLLEQLPQGRRRGEAGRP